MGALAGYKMEGVGLGGRSCCRGMGEDGWVARRAERGEGVWSSGKYGGMGVTDVGGFRLAKVLGEKVPRGKGRWGEWGLTADVLIEEMFSVPYAVPPAISLSVQ